MKGFLNFFARWVVPVLGLLALSLIIWFLGPLLRLGNYEPLASATSRWVLIVLLFLVWIGFRVLRIVQARRNAAKVMQSLAEVSAPDAASVATAEELATLKQRMDEALALRTEGYEAQSVAAFDRALADWTNEAAFHAREERIRRLLCSYEEDGPEAEFVLGTLAAAMGACSARHYGGYCTQITPAYTDAAAYTRSEDVFGDSYVVYEASASYTIRYQMPDESMLTVGERDRILTSYRDAVQAFLDGKTEDELSKEEAMTRALKRELKRLDQSLSTQWMALEGTRLDDYFAYGPEGGETP